MSPLSRIVTRMLVMFLVLFLFISPLTAGQQRFLAQPWDLTVVAGDKVRQCSVGCN